MRSLIRCSRWVSSSPLMKSRASPTDLRQNSAMLIPPTVTAKLSGLRRSPWQSGQGTRLIEFQFFPHPVAVGFLIPPLQIVDHALELGGEVPLPYSFLRTISIFSPLLPYNRMSKIFFGSWLMGVSEGKNGNEPPIPRLHLGDGSAVDIAPAAGTDRSLADGQVAVGNDQIGVNGHIATQTRAFWDRRHKGY